MGCAATLLKTVEGVTYRYDRIFDIISEDIPKIGASYDRTQTSRIVDLCSEITTRCELACLNCFADSRKGVGRFLPYHKLSAQLAQGHTQLLRLSLTGGEPTCHPEILKYLELPDLFPDIGYVISTNGTLVTGLELPLIENGWLVAISLHGRKDTHNRYTRSQSFDKVRDTIERLAKRCTVHIYCVIHHLLDPDDVDWLIAFRQEVGAGFLRFILPRAFGRFHSASAASMVDYVRCRLDSRSGIKDKPSKTIFLTVNGELRESN